MNKYLKALIISMKTLKKWFSEKTREEELQIEYEILKRRVSYEEFEKLVYFRKTKQIGR